MADLESRMERLETKVIEHDIRFEQVMTRVDMVSAKVDMFIEESRESRKRHDEEMREFRERHDADMREIRQNIDGMGKHVRNLTMTAMGGIIASGVGIAAIVVVVLLK